MAKVQTILEKVIAAESELKAMKAHTALREWANTNGMNNRSAFPRFKKALLEIGVDYEEIRNSISTATRNALLSDITHEVTLYSDAKASAGRYGICDRNGDVVWHGRFFDSDNAGEQSRAELAAASKAVWLANKVRETIGAAGLRLNLIVDAQWLTYQSHGGQKGYKLTQLAKKYNLDLNVEWIPGSRNPADEWTVSSGYKRWDANDLKSLAQPLNRGRI